MVFKTTKDIKVPKELIDQVIGQDEAVNIVKKVAKQRRNLLLIGQPGTGKSLIGQALSSLLPKENLLDVVSFHNFNDDNLPLIKNFQLGKGKDLVEKAKIQEKSSLKFQNVFLFILLILAMISPWWIRSKYGDVMAAASLIGSMMFVVCLVLFLNLGKRARLNEKNPIPKLLINNSGKKTAPFFDGSGAHAGALLGDVLHDPLQSFSIGNKVLKSNGRNSDISLEVNKFLRKYRLDLIKKDGYLASYLSEGELDVLGEEKGMVKDSGVLSVNKYKSDKPYLVKVVTESGKELIVSPEHKVAVRKKGRKSWVEAFKLRTGNEVFVLDS